MTLNHQVRMINLMTRAGSETRLALAQAQDNAGRMKHSILAVLVLAGAALAAGSLEGLFLSATLPLFPPRHGFGVLTVRATVDQLESVNS